MSLFEQVNIGEVMAAKEVFRGTEWRDCATFYYGSAHHMPNIPEVFRSNGEKKCRKALVVDHQEGLHVISNGSSGIRYHFGSVDLFLLLPRKEVRSSMVVPKDGREDDLFHAFETLQKSVTSSDCRHKSSSGSVAVLDGKDSRYVHFGTRSKRFGKGIMTGMKNMSAMKHTEDFERLSSWIKQVERLAWKYITPDMRKLMKATSHPLKMALRDGAVSSVWPGLVCGKNVFLNVHKDDDYVMSLVTVIGEDKDDKEAIVCYFCFPSLGEAVPLRHGDLLLFNPNIEHCVSSRCNPNRDAYCVSLYFDPKMVGGNDNGQRLEGKEIEAAERLLPLAIEGRAAKLGKR